jgi:solute carrier family 25 (mitochondrial 2-oxodicarboxylate transporter), member 21
MYPLDVVKTRFQLQVKGSGEQYTGMIDCFQKIIKNEGYVHLILQGKAIFIDNCCRFSRLYRGIVPPILMEAPKRATKFAANDSWGSFYKKTFGVSTMNQSLSVLTGATAGATEAFVVVPFELVKIRLQDRASAGRYNGAADAVAKIIKNEGILALYNGLEATLWRYLLSFYLGLLLCQWD